MKTDSSTPTIPPTRLALGLAFAAVYIIWGSTYLAIKVAVETIPPFFMAATRFLVAGVLLMTMLRLRGTPLPNRRQWMGGTVAGLLLLLGGNGMVAYAEQSIVSSVAALMIATTPVWFAFFEWARPGGSPPKLRTVIGIAISLVGVWMLVAPKHGGPMTVPWFGLCLLLFACMSWAAGSLYGKHSVKPSSPWMGAATQMIGGGVGLVLAAGLNGELGRLHLHAVTSHSWLALAYLIVFGSWVGFSAYIWLLKVSTPSLVSTYAFVNPVVAVFLGWAMGGEPVTSGMIAATVVIVAGVVVITLPLEDWSARLIGKRVETPAS